MIDKTNDTPSELTAIDLALSINTIIPPDTLLSTVIDAYTMNIAIMILDVCNSIPSLNVDDVANTVSDNIKEYIDTFRNEIKEMNKATPH